MYQPGGDANPDQFAPLNQVERFGRGMRASTVPTASSYYSMLDSMCVPCYNKKGMNECVYTGGAPTKYDPRDVPQTLGSSYVACEPPRGVFTGCYFPEAAEHMTDKCSNYMFDQGMAMSMARKGGQQSNMTPQSLQALASLAAQRREACPSYLCKNDESYKGAEGRKSFAASSCACVSESVSAQLKKKGKAKEHKKK